MTPIEIIAIIVTLTAVISGIVNMIYYNVQGAIWSFTTLVWILLYLLK